MTAGKDLPGTTEDAMVFLTKDIKAQGVEKMLTLRTDEIHQEKIEDIAMKIEDSMSFCQ